MTERIAIAGRRPDPIYYLDGVPKAPMPSGFRARSLPVTPKCAPPPKAVASSTLSKPRTVNGKSPLTKRQKAILDFIRQSIASKGFPPSIREIGDAVGLTSSSTVHSHLKALEAKRFIRRNPSSPRSIELLDVSTHRVIRLTGNAAQCQSLLTTITEMAAVLAEDGATGEAVDSLCFFRDQLAEQMQRGAE